LIGCILVFVGCLLPRLSMRGVEPINGILAKLKRLMEHD
jgi:hypothetical protein